MSTFSGFGFWRAGMLYMDCWGPYGGWKIGYDSASPFFLLLLLLRFHVPSLAERWHCV
jgi:hypothetical protein